MGPGSDEVDEIRQQIDESRENLGSAVGALAYKADVKNRGKEAIEDKKEMVMEKVDTLKSKVSSDDEGDGGIGEKIKSKLPAGEDVSAKLDAIKSKAPGSDAAGRIGEAAPSKEDVKRKAQDAAAAAGDKPIAVMAGAAAAGLAAGLALPKTDLEREKLGPAAQNARAQAQIAAQQAIEHAKQVGQQVAASAAEAVKQTGQEHGGKLGEIAEKTQEHT